MAMVPPPRPNGTRARQNYNDPSVTGYIADDVSSVQSSALGGIGVGANSAAYTQNFGNFANLWPTLPNASHGRGGPAGNMQNGMKGPGSVAGSELTDVTSTDGGKSYGQGGVSLGGNLNLQEVHKTPSLNQADRLKRYVEGDTNRPASGGYRGGPVARPGQGRDDDVSSITTGFSSQIDVGGYD